MARSIRPCKHGNDEVPVCRDCARQRRASKKWKDKNAASYAIQNRANSLRWRRENPEKAKRIGREKSWREVGILDWQIAWGLLAFQQRCCAVCRRHESEFNQNLHLDHDHETLHVRGFLCHGCNTGSGLADSIDLLRAKIEYLLSPPVVAFRQQNLANSC